MTEYNFNSNKISPDGRAENAGFVNRNGVAKISHFMLTFSAPNGSPLAAEVQSNILTTFNANIEFLP